MHYILDGRMARPCASVMEWALWFQNANRHVAQTSVGDVNVSTVFLGIDHGYGGALLLFETMVFGGPLDEELDRYATWEQAEMGHEAMVARVRAALGVEP